MNPAVPPPTGKYAVGRSLHSWTDAARTDPYAPSPGSPRALVVWVWYPAAPGGDAAPYLPPGWEPTGSMLGLRTAGLTAHSVADAPLAADEISYPVVLLSPSGFPPLLLSGFAEELASHGFVVAGINHTYETAVTVFPSGEVATMNPAAIAGALGPQTGSYPEVFARRAEVCAYKTQDLSFVADCLGSLLPGRLDLDRVSAAGHSFGGSAALQWCHDDPRCRSAVNLDGALWTPVGQTGVGRPVLQIVAPHPEFDLPSADPAWLAAEKEITLGGWRTVDQADAAVSVRIAGASHLSFMDVPFLPVEEGSPAGAMLAATTIDPDRMHAVTGALLVAFLSTGDITGALVPGVTSPL